MDRLAPLRYLVLSVLRGSLCELHMKLGGAEFAAFLQCKE
ncbi:Hok/Gef family protein [Salmonella enterica]|nr:Hok/Gef family protein [Salmonella enterica]EEG5325067.1 Hok/Gef family protein [Salmonella enterica]EGG5311463.1 Hok/Gef family protein [Salmonella enterica]